MARKSTFTREDVIEATLRIIESEGIASVTARHVAERMGSSTAPVYSNFGSMEDLVREAMSLVAQQVLVYCRQPATDDPFLDMGVGFVRFAHERPKLFRALYLDSTIGHEADQEAMEELLADLANHPYMGRLPVDHRRELLFQTSIYTFGIATTMAAGHWHEDPDFEVITGWLRSVGGLLIRAAFDSAQVPCPAELAQRAGEFVVPWRHPHCPHRKKTNHED